MLRRFDWIGAGAKPPGGLGNDGAGLALAGGSGDDDIQFPGLHWGAGNCEVVIGAGVVVVGGCGVSVWSAGAGGAGVSVTGGTNGPGVADGVVVGVAGSGLQTSFKFSAMRRRIVASASS